VDISNEAVRCLLIDPRAALVMMRPGDVFEASVFRFDAEGMRRCAELQSEGLLQTAHRWELLTRRVREPSVS
jgi:hypothetical protein